MRKKISIEYESANKDFYSSDISDDTDSLTIFQRSSYPTTGFKMIRISNPQQMVELIKFLEEIRESEEFKNIKWEVE